MDTDINIDCTISYDEYIKEIDKNVDGNVFNDNQQSYIQSLKEIIYKQYNLIKKLHDKITQLNKVVINKDNSTQTEPYNKPEKSNNNGWLNNEHSIEESVKKVAENAMNKTSFVYDSTSGLYYDYNTGYYYDAERSLYYDGNSGTYYYYDKDKNMFNFYSQVTPTAATVPVQTTDCKTDPKDESPKKRSRRKARDDYEEGECIDDDLDLSEIESDDDEEMSQIKSSENSSTQAINVAADSSITAKDTPFDETIKAWPPCMRVIVQETKLENLDVGTLFIVTCQGGTIGREGVHSILIPDKNISKYHAKLMFDDSSSETKEKGNYVIVDLGSRNGTYLDGKRLSSALQESQPHPVLHKSCIKVGGTILVCHIHLGLETCPECEPGLLLPITSKDSNTITSKSTLRMERMKKLKEIKKKFGLENADNETTLASVPAAGYEDRAEMRRKNVGSSSEHFKTEMASVSQPIEKTNPGYRMLSKMGWKTGDSLGTTVVEGIKEPIPVSSKSDKSGLGYEGPAVPSVNNANSAFRKKQEIWKKTRRRYKEIAK